MMTPGLQQRAFSWDGYSSLVSFSALYRPMIPKELNNFQAKETFLERLGYYYYFIFIFCPSYI